MKHLGILAIASAALAASSLSAHACNPLLGKDYGKFVHPTVPAYMLAKADPHAPAQTSIVGEWHVVHTASDGSLFLESFDQWHSDGTEEELGKLPPATGPLCLGIWSQTGRTVDLITHVTWLYDLNNNWVGTLNLTESNVVKPKGVNAGNIYTGPFDAKFYDTNGNQFMEVTGTTKAERLTGN